LPSTIPRGAGAGSPECLVGGEPADEQLRSCGGAVVASGRRSDRPPGHSLQAAHSEGQYQAQDCRQLGSLPCTARPWPPQGQGGAVTRQKPTRPSPDDDNRLGPRWRSGCWRRGQTWTAKLTIRLERPRCAAAGRGPLAHHPESSFGRTCDGGLAQVAPCSSNCAASASFGGRRTGSMCVTWIRMSRSLHPGRLSRHAGWHQ
jgi:hypothetical protein